MTSRGGTTIRGEHGVNGRLRDANEAIARQLLAGERPVEHVAVHGAEADLQLFSRLSTREVLPDTFYTFRQHGWHAIRCVKPCQLATGCYGVSEGVTLSRGLVGVSTYGVLLRL